jgi:TPR repeat protein
MPQSTMRLVFRMRLIRPLAEQRNANTQYNLGVFYDNGLGVPQDRARAYVRLSLLLCKVEKVRQLFVVYSDLGTR